MIQLDKIKNRVEKEIFTPILCLQELEEGVMNYTYELTTKYRQYILKINPIGRDNISIKESNAIKICNNYKINVPQLLICHKSDSIIENSFLLYKKLEGTSLNHIYKALNASEIEKITTQLSSHFNIISSINLPLAGDTIDFKKFTNQSWQDFLLQEIDGGIDFLIKNKISTVDKIDNLRKQLENDVNKLELKESCFVWADFDPSNIIIDTNLNFNGFIDFEGVISGDPEYALGCFIAKYGYDTFSSMLIGKLDCNIKKLDLYAIIRYLRLIKYSNDKLPTGKKRDEIKDFLPYAYNLTNHLL